MGWCCIELADTLKRRSASSGRRSPAELRVGVPCPWDCPSRGQSDSVGACGVRERDLDRAERQNVLEHREAPLGQRPIRARAPRVRRVCSCSAERRHHAPEPRRHLTAAGSSRPCQSVLRNGHRTGCGYPESEPHQPRSDQPTGTLSCKARQRTGGTAAGRPGDLAAQRSGGDRYRTGVALVLIGDPHGVDEVVTAIADGHSRSEAALDVDLASVRDDSRLTAALAEQPR